MTNTYDDPFTPSVTGNPVSDSGLVAGSTEVGRYDRAAVYDLHRHTLTVLGTLGGRSAWATDVNTAGDVVGYSQVAPRGETHAFLLTGRTGVLRDLGTLGGLYSQATAVNDAGVVVGWASTPETSPRAFVWDPNVNPVRMRELPLPPGANTSTATGVNAKGQVVGKATRNIGGNGDEAFLWDPTTAQVSVLASPPGARIVGAVDITDSGFVVGPAEVSRVGPSGAYVLPSSYRWNPTTRASTLMIVPPGQPSYAGQVRAINRHGIIVGGARRDGVDRLVVWNLCGTQVYVQPALEGQASDGVGVNRYGEIVGTSTASPIGGAEFVRAEPCTAK